MTPQQIQQAEQRLMQWRASHSDQDSRREAYRREILTLAVFTQPLEKVNLA